MRGKSLGNIPNLADFGIEETPMEVDQEGYIFLYHLQHESMPHPISQMTVACAIPVIVSDRLASLLSQIAERYEHIKSKCFFNFF